MELETGGNTGIVCCEKPVLPLESMGEVPAHAVTEGHVWVCGHAMAGFYVKICGSLPPKATDPAPCLGSTVELALVA